MPSFYKANRTDDAWELMTRDFNAFVLLSQIAYRAKWAADAVTGLEPGQAFIGDFERCGFTEQTYRTAKAHLEKYRLVTFKPTIKGTIATIVSTSVYDINIEQGNGQNNGQPTSLQRPLNVTPTTNKNVRKKKEKKEEVPKRKFLDFVYLTDEEYTMLVAKFGQQGADERISNLNIGIGSKGYKYESHYFTILNWERNHEKDKKHNTPTFDSIPPVVRDQNGETPRDKMMREIKEQREKRYAGEQA